MVKKDVCDKCSKKATVKFNQQYCDDHFLQTIEKRIRKNIRKQDIDIKHQFYLIKQKGHEYELTKHFLKKIFEGRLKIKEVTKKQPKNNIYATSLDEEATKFLNEFFNNKKIELKGIKPLDVVMQKEQKEICRILQIPFEDKKDFLTQFEEQYPGTKYSLKKTMEHFKERKIQ